jgi:F-type H+-transporting ATPase subunit b
VTRLRWYSGFLGLLLLSTAAFAEGSGGDPAFTPLGTALRYINSAIVVAGIIWAFRKLRATFRGRADSISGAIQQAAAARQEAERRVREVEAKLARMDQEVAALRAAAQRDAAAEAERIRALTAEEAQKVERAAAMEIDASQRAARMELKALGARLAVERAEALLRKQITPAAEAQILRGFVDDLAGSAN